jgi:hypothetical protein
MSDDDRIAYLAGEPAVIDDVAERAELDDLRDLLADPGVWADPPAALEDAVVASITAAAASSPAAVAPASVAPAPVAPAPLHPPVVSLDAARRRRALRAGTLAAAAAVAVVMSAVLLTRGDDAATDSLAMALEPTELAPAASGDATLTRTESGWRIELDAAGLPRLDGGRFYQAWLRDADGNLVPIGTFNESTDVVLWAGVSPREFPTLTVTEEANDGDQASSGRRVLVGTISADQLDG